MVQTENNNNMQQQQQKVEESGKTIDIIYVQLIMYILRYSHTTILYCTSK